MVSLTLRSFRVAARKTRYRAFGMKSGQKPPIAELQFRSHCVNPDCRPNLVSSAGEIARYARDGTPYIVRPFLRTAAVTDLSAFATPGDYLRAVSKETQGKYNRAANKARREGYVTAMTGHNAYLGSLYKMKSSIKYRSLGAVAEAFQAIPAELPDARTPYESPTCDEHWRVDFGVFREAERIESKAFARLQRCGDFVIVMHMIGHADILAVGGMKLLQFEIMEWLLKRQTPMVAGLRYLLHGAIEDGNAGLADWRRYVRQCPALLRYIVPADAQFPVDFDPERYLELHPDVRALGMDARRHFAEHGIFMGYDYRAR
jgi:hypothetical protein